MSKPIYLTYSKRHKILFCFNHALVVDESIWIEFLRFVPVFWVGVN